MLYFPLKLSLIVSEEAISSRRRPPPPETTTSEASDYELVPYTLVVFQANKSPIVLSPQKLIKVVDF